MKLIARTLNPRIDGRLALAEIDGRRFYLKSNPDHGEVLRELTAHRFAEAVSVVPVPKARVVEHDWDGYGVPEPTLAIREVPGGKPFDLEDGGVPALVLLGALAASSVVRFVLGDFCGHPQNYLVDPSGKLWMIDFGACFYDPPNYWKFMGTVFSAMRNQSLFERREVRAKTPLGPMLEQLKRIEAAPAHSWAGVPKVGVDEINARLAGLRQEVIAFWSLV